MTKFLVAGIDSEKYFGVRKSKFQTNLSEGKVDFYCNFEPCFCMDVFLRLYLLHKFVTEKEINTDLAGNVVLETLLKPDRFQLVLQKVGY